MSKRSSSIVLLTTSIVLAVAVFLFAYMLKPNDETDVLKKARERQSQSLVSVQKPLETDQNVLTKEEEMKNAVYELLLNDKEFAAAVASQLSSDEQFTDTIYTRVTPKLDSYLDAKVDGYVAEFTPQIKEYVADLYASEDPTVYIDQLIEPITVRIYTDLAAQITADIHKAFADDFATQFAGAKNTLEDEIFNKVLEHLDTIAPDYVAQIKAEATEGATSAVIDSVNAQVPVYEANLRSYIDEQVSSVIEEEAVALYDKYSEGIITEIVNEVLLRLDDVVLSQPATQATPVVEQKPVVEEPKVEKHVVKPISAPTFVSSTTERSMTNDEYIKERTDRRNAIINDIIQKLK